MSLFSVVKIITQPPISFFWRGKALHMLDGRKMPQLYLSRDTSKSRRNSDKIEHMLS
jgi:hypothetical protein